MLGSRADTNLYGGKYGNTLHAATYRGYEEVVKVPLNHDADADLEGGYWENPLQAVIMQGQIRVTQLLLESDASIETEALLYRDNPAHNNCQASFEARTPLRTAVMQSDLQIIHTTSFG